MSVVPSPLRIGLKGDEMPKCLLCNGELNPKYDDLYQCPICSEVYERNFIDNIPTRCGACGRKGTESNLLEVSSDGFFNCALCNRIDRLVEAGQLDYTVGDSIIQDPGVQS